GYTSAHDRPCSSRAVALPPAPGRGWRADQLLEGAAESGLRPVANVSRDHRDARTATRKQSRRHLHAPLREIVHRRLADEVHEAISESQARQPDLARQLLNRPGMSWHALHERECIAVVYITHPGETVGGISRDDNVWRVHTV